MACATIQFVHFNKADELPNYKKPEKEMFEEVAKAQAKTGLSIYLHQLQLLSSQSRARST